MDYTLGTEETIGHGIRRIYSTCLQQTASIIRPPFRDLRESIHHTRKNFTFMRALIRLIKDPLGQEVYDRHDRFFHDTGRFISELRDIHVMDVTLQYVATESHSVRQKDIEPGIKELQQREQNWLDETRRQNRFEKIASDLEEKLDNFEADPEIPDNFAVLLPGIKDIFRQGQNDLLQAKEKNTKEHFHAWEKQVIYLLHLFHILQNYWPEELNISGKSLRQLSKYLGEEHDLSLIDDLLIDQDFSQLLKNTKAMGTYVDQKRSFLQRSALNLGEFIYTKSGDEFIAFFN